MTLHPALPWWLLLPLMAAGVLLFRIHGRRTELFADGLMPAKPGATRAPPSAPLPQPPATVSQGPPQA